MSIMTGRLQAMIATLDGVLDEPESMPAEPIVKHSITGITLTIDERIHSRDLNDWVTAFFQHPERIQIKRFEVKR